MRLFRISSPSNYSLRLSNMEPTGLSVSHPKTILPTWLSKYLIAPVTNATATATCDERKVRIQQKHNIHITIPYTIYNNSYIQQSESPP